jgi:hypothetical protein
VQGGRNMKTWNSVLLIVALVALAVVPAQAATL